MYILSVQTFPSRDSILRRVLRQRGLRGRSSLPVIFSVVRTILSEHLSNIHKNRIRFLAMTYSAIWVSFNRNPYFCYPLLHVDPSMFMEHIPCTGRVFIALLEHQTSACLDRAPHFLTVRAARDQSSDNRSCGQYSRILSKNLRDL